MAHGIIGRFCGLFLTALFTVGMRLPCQTLSNQQMYEEVIREVHQVAETVVRTSKQQEAFERAVVVKRLVEVDSEGREQVRLKEEPLSPLEEILSRNDPSRMAAEGKLLMDLLIQQGDKLRSRVVLRSDREAPQESVDPVVISTQGRLLEVMIAEGKLDAVADGLLAVADHFRVPEPIKIVLTPTQDRNEGFSVNTAPPLHQSAACALGEAIGRNAGLVAEISKIFTARSNLAALEVNITQDAMGFSSVEIVPVVREVTRKERSRMLLPHQAPPVMRRYEPGVAYAPVYNRFGMPYVSTGSSVCRCGF